MTKTRSGARSHVIDIGPGAGSEGGRLVAEGSVEDIMKCKESVTGRFLASPEIHNGIPHRPVRPGKTPTIAVLGASLHNLRIPKVEFPLNRLTVVTGRIRFGEIQPLPRPAPSESPGRAAGKGLRSGLDRMP